MPALRKFAAQWSEPMPWTIVLVFILLAILADHDKIAKAIGTAAPVQSGTVTASQAAANPPAGLVSAAVATTAHAAPLPTHAPRDPFRALVSQRGDKLPVVTLPVTKTASHGPTHHGGTTTGTTATGGSTAANCAAVHVVQSGDSLWGIAAQRVNDTGHGSAAHYWHKIYAANTSAIGSDPSQIAVGLRLCLPTS